MSKKKSIDPDIYAGKITNDCIHDQSCVPGKGGVWSSVSSRHVLGL